MSKVTKKATVANTSSMVGGIDDHSGYVVPIDNTGNSDVEVNSGRVLEGMAEMVTALTPPMKTSGSAISADIYGNVLTLTFSHGEAIEIDAAKLSPAMAMQAMLHGLKQKLVDAAAIARDINTGRSATIQDKFAAVKEVYERITGNDPTWNKGRSEGGTGGGNNGGGLLLTALMQLTGKTREATEVYLSDKTTEQKTALRQNPRVAGIIITLQAAKAKKSVNTDAMLDDFMAE